MPKRKKVAPPDIFEIKLPFGFKPMKTTVMSLDVLGLRKVMVSRMESLRKAMGTAKAEKLANFCAECLLSGNATVYVTVVARTSTEGENGHSYLCLCPCMGEMEVFTLRSSFFVRVSLDEQAVSGLMVRTTFQNQQPSLA